MVQFRIDVVIATKQAVTGTKRVGKQLDSLNKKANTLRATLRRTFLQIGGGILIVQAIRTLSSFGQAMATVGAIVRATEAQFAQLSNTAQRLGITTVFSATQAADAMVKLARAGFSVSETNKAVADTLRLAQAGGLGLAQAADIAASTLRGFRIAVEDAGRVTDVLTLAANSSNTTVAQLGEGLKFVAPIAAGLGVSLEQTAGAMGLIADAGLKATLAGTGLRRVMAELESPTGATQKILAKLGVTTDEIRVSQVGLIGALKRLKSAGIDTGLALQIFGQRGGPAFQIMVSNIPQIQRLTDKLENAGGEAKRVADILDKTLRSSLIRVRSALAGVVIAFGEAGASSFLITVLNGIAVALRSLAKVADIAAVALLGVAAGFLKVKASAIGAGLVSITKRFGLMSAAMLKAGGATGGLAIGFFLLINRLIQSRANIAALKKSIEEVADEAGFSKFGAQINTSRKELEKLQQRLKSGAKVSDETRLRMEKLAKGIRGVVDMLQGRVKVQKELAGIQVSQKTTEKQILDRLDREIIALRLVNEGTQEGIDLAERANKLAKAGDIGEVGKANIANKLRSLDAAKLEIEILERIKGPQLERNRELAALDNLLKKSRISLEAFNEERRSILGIEEKTAATDPQDVLIVALEDANEVIRTRINLGKLDADVLRIKLDLEKRIFDETGKLKALDESDLVIIREKLNTKRTLLKIEENITKEKQFQENVSKLEKRFDPNLKTSRQLELEALAQKRPELQGVQRELDKIKLSGLEASTALEDGFSRAFLSMRLEAEDFASVAAAAVNSFADNSTDALIQLAITGKGRFKDFANAVVEDLIRIITRLLVIQAITAVIGGPATGGANALNTGINAGFGGSREHGGTVQPGRSFLVGENGPELFKPDRTGTIIPGAPAAIPAPEVTVQVVNIQSEEDIPKIIEAGGADTAILNVVRRKPDAFKQVLG